MGLTCVSCIGGFVRRGLDVCHVLGGIVCHEFDVCVCHAFGGFVRHGLDVCVMY